MPQFPHPDLALPGPCTGPVEAKLQQHCRHRRPCAGAKGSGNLPLIKHRAWIKALRLVNEPGTLLASASPLFIEGSPAQRGLPRHPHGIGSLPPSAAGPSQGFVPAGEGKVKPPQSPHCPRERTEPAAMKNKKNPKRLSHKPNKLDRGAVREPPRSLLLRQVWQEIGRKCITWPTPRDFPPPPLPPHLLLLLGWCSLWDQLFKSLVMPRFPRDEKEMGADGDVQVRAGLGIIWG